MNALSIILKSLLRYISLCLFLCGMAVADGMQPETTVVILNEEEGEATLNVKNTDPGPALLHSVIQNIPEDLEPLLIVTPPISGSKRVTLNWCASSVLRRYRSRPSA